MEGFCHQGRPKPWPSIARPLLCTHAYGYFNLLYLVFHVPLLTPLLQQNKQNQAVVDKVDAEGKTFDIILYGERQAGAGLAWVPAPHRWGPA